MTTRTYQNFDLLITRTVVGDHARVSNVLAGQATVAFVLLFRPHLFSRAVVPALLAHHLWMVREILHE